MPNIPSLTATFDKQPPTDDPTLPSYQCPDYMALQLDRTMMGEVYKGGLNCIENPEKYLPKNTNEGGAYPGRLIRTVFENHAQPIINAYAGALNMVTYEDVPQAILDCEQDIDMQGNSLEVFFDTVDIAAMRDGLTYVLVDYYARDVNDRASEIEQAPRPFLRHINASQIINYCLEKGKIEKCTIRECFEVDLAYGSNVETVYRVVNGGNWKVVRLIEDKTKKDNWIEQVVTDEDGNLLEGQYTNAAGQPLDDCPIVVYKITGSGHDQPYFFDLAKLNIRLYQSQSDYWELLHKCNWPVPCFAVAKGADLRSADGSISLGPNDALMLGENGNAFYLQPTADSSTASREAIADLKAAINSYGLTSSLQAEKGKAKTATEIRVLFSTVQKVIARFALAKESAITTCYELMGQFLGLAIDKIGTISVCADVSALLTDEASIVALYSAGLLSIESAVERLTQLGYQSDAAEEILRLKQVETEQQQAIAASLQPTNDYQKSATIG